MLELEPCPLCGGTVEVIRRGNDLTKRSITIRCPACRIQLTNAALRNGWEWLERVTETAWNRRAPDPRIEKAREALARIAKGEGRYSHDPLTHASNTIDDMKVIAVEALAALEVE